MTAKITTHLKVIYGEGELEEASTCKDYLQVQQEDLADDAELKRYLETKK